MTNPKNPKTHHISAFSLLEISIVILVIGILIAGITNGMDLYQDYRVEMAKQITIKSRVATMPNLVVWLESSQKSSFEPNNIGEGAKITKWKNIVPNLVGKLDATLESGSAGPSFKQNIQSSLAGAYFELGKNNCISIPVGYDSGSTENSVFLVVKLDKTNPGGVRIMSTWNSSRLYWIQLYITGLGVGYQSGNFFLYSAVTNNGSYYKNKAELRNYYQKPNLVKFYHNKNLIPDPEEGYAPPDYSYKNAKISIGCKVGIGYDYPSMFVHELIVFDRYLKDRERIIVEDYLYKKWNL